ncbi:hypothetical protein IFM89_027282 [Coptis chinensis]|uniref:Uncharacterized protein n=1 Tax=Coptis chinensis TaxID=261450 RepID=A0A835HBW9_9MAGN|nr:hypothetical protein IFM89_027282 [Coptis chinensis]
MGVPRASASLCVIWDGTVSREGKFRTGIDIELFLKNQEPAVEKLKEPILDEVTSALAKRYPLNITRHETSSLWFLCKQEASLLNTTDRACGLFSPYENTILRDLMKRLDFDLLIFETVVPFSCAFGLFLDGAEFAQIQRDEALELPLKPPHKRNWRGSTVAPFAGNNILVL